MSVADISDIHTATSIRGDIGRDDLIPIISNAEEQVGIQINASTWSGLAEQTFLVDHLSNGTPDRKFVDEHFENIITLNGVFQDFQLRGGEVEKRLLLEEMVGRETSIV